MKKTLLFCLMSLSLSAQAANLLPPGSRDQAPSRLVSAPAPAGEFERKPVAFAWALDPWAELEAPAPFVAESREYWALAEASEMQAGLSIDTTAPGALIRVSPAAGSDAVEPGQLRMLRNGKAIAEPETFARRANAAQLKAAGMEVPDGSAIVQLAPEQGKGRFQVQLAEAKGRYLVHVFEPNSEYVLKAQAGRRSVLAGDTLEVSADLANGTSKMAGGEVGGSLISPSGRSYDLAFRNGKAQIQVPDEAGTTPGLWEVHLSSASFDQGASIQRDARTAVEVTRPTARLGGGYRFDAAAVRFELPVQVAAAGRYELRGTLFATGADGVARPVAQAHAANWFEPGARQLSLAFGRGNVPSGFGAPYELRFVELKDQARMGTLETRELAVRGAGATPTPRAVRPRDAAAPGRGTAGRETSIR
ncbi:DUF4785 domain-containing protein [Arenimonas metalli]|uniref:DUF4785 domain-containing protein n=1 Tax=Arenimonas metalli CF5-1 TaxID=1384056 RepID=A0A091B7P4_9GAMM|nr:DUF4785 domain-containing protein [Arenimonas metalli]KFN46864.1 hypothetical protein N787_00795 [Arenimonas metalli CF5-1]